MTPTALDRVFGRSRLKMVTGPYVDVYREATPPGARRRYTKRFVSTRDGDFREWTEREWRILARLVGHGARHVPDVVQYDRGAGGGDPLVQTYDAGVTVDHWATLLPVQRGAKVQRHIFQDCAHWWALARHLLLALHEIHALKLVHLDLKADNICLPFAPPGFHPATANGAPPELIYPVFEDIALIDFAFSLISGERLTSPLPIGWQRTFPYQSPRLLKALEAGQGGDLEPTRQLDWRCDMFSLAALLTCYLPGPEEITGAAGERGWTESLHAEARTLLRRIRNSHASDAGSSLPHLSMAAACAVQSQMPALAHSLSQGWSLAADVQQVDAMAPTAPLTPVTLIEPRPASVAAPVTEIFVMRDADAAAAVAPTAPADPRPSPPAARASDPTPVVVVPTARPTQPAVHAAQPWTAPSPGAVNPADPDAVDVATDSIEPGLDFEVRTPPSPAWAQEPATERSTTPPPEEVVVDAAQRPLPRRRARLASLTYVLPLLGLAAAGAWLVTGLSESRRGEPPAAGTGSQVADRGALPAAPPAAVRSGPPAAQPHTPPAMQPNAPQTPPPPTLPPTTELPRSAPAADAANKVAPVAATRAEEPPTAPLARRPDPAPVAGPPTAPSATTPAAVQTPLATPGTAAEPQVAEDRNARRAREIVSRVVPAVVERATPRIGVVLAAAAQAQNAADDRRTLAAAESIGDEAFTDAELRLTAVNSSAQARQLNAAAHKAFWQGGDVARAFALQWQAFGAQPQDAEIAGNLAFYAMKQNPRQAEMARDLAIYALATATRTTRPSRLEDWGSLAVASALSGRPNDSANAMLVLLTVSKDVQRSCRSALSSVASFGPALREPARALLTRVNARGAATTPYCELPPKWNLGSKLP